jgi:hypothetical protein
MTKKLISLTALRLHASARMRLLLLALLLLLLAPDARAATGTCMPGSGAGTTGAKFSGTVGISFKDSSGNLQSVQAASVPFVFSAAECQCNTMDLNLDVFLTGTLSQGSTGSAEVWVGTGCDVLANRSNATQTTCEKLNTTISFNEFTLGGAPTTGSFPIPITGSAALFSPQKHLCNQAAASNQIFIFLFQDAANPFGVCTLPLTEQIQGPAAPQNPSASSGDSAVTLSWNPPSVSTGNPPSFYQILCADANGNPVPGATSGTTQQFSTCLPGNVIDRKALPTGGTVSTGSDAGVTLDLGTASVGLGDESLHTEAADPDGGVTDAGAGQGPTTTNLPAPFTNLDPRFICAQFIQASGTSYTQRVDGLNNGQSYQFTILGIDQFGNATPSDVLFATPQPTEDLYRRYHDAGGRASGFCFIATAAWGSYEHPFVKVLRDFRDEVLLPRSTGRAFVDWYYAHSPPAADYIAEHPAMRILAQLLLWPVIGAAAFWLYLSAFTKILLLSLALMLVYRKRLAARLRSA